MPYHEPLEMDGPRRTILLLSRFALNVPLLLGREVREWRAAR
jgi:hypothetical protein